MIEWIETQKINDYTGRPDLYTHIGPHLLRVWHRHCGYSWNVTLDTEGGLLQYSAKSHEGYPIERMAKGICVKKCAQFMRMLAHQDNEIIIILEAYIPELEPTIERRF